MAEFKRVEDLLHAWPEVEVAAERVTDLTAAGFPKVDSDLEWIRLEAQVAAARSLLERLRAESLETGKGTQGRKTDDMVKRLLERQGLQRLPECLAVFDIVVSRGRSALMEAPVIPVLPDALTQGPGALCPAERIAFALELRRILEAERLGGFTSLYHESCTDQCAARCSHCAKEEIKLATVARMLRNLDRHEPAQAERRQRGRRAATEIAALMALDDAGALRPEERDLLRRLRRIES